MTQKKVSNTHIIGIIALLVVAGAVGYFVYKKPALPSAQTQQTQSSETAPTTTQSSGVPAGWETYTDQRDGFTIEYPGNFVMQVVSSTGNAFYWDVYDPTTPSMKTKLSSKQFQGVPNTSVSPDVNSLAFFVDVTPTTYKTVQDDLKATAGASGGIFNITSDTPTNIDGVEVWPTSYTTPDGNTYCNANAFMAIRNNNFFAFTDPASCYGTSTTPLISKILATFHFIP